MQGMAITRGRITIKNLQQLKIFWIQSFLQGKHWNYWWVVLLSVQFSDNGYVWPISYTIRFSSHPTLPHVVLLNLLYWLFLIKSTDSSISDQSTIVHGSDTHVARIQLLITCIWSITWKLQINKFAHYYLYSEWTDNGQLWVQYVSSTPATRLDVVNLQEKLDHTLQARQARETGICPVRAELYSQCFDELIRQITINCAERGLLLLRVRDEAKMTVSAYETLYESSIAFGEDTCTYSYHIQ